MKKIFKFSVLPILALAVVACGDDEIKRSESPAFNEDADQVFFYAENPSTVELLPSDSVFELYVGREVHAYANDVKLKIVDNTGAFTIPSSVSFAAGDSIDTIQVWVDTKKLEFFKEYRIEVSIADSKSVNPYVAAEEGVLSWAINVIVSDFKKFDDVMVTSGWYEESWEDEILYSEILDQFKYVFEPGCAITFSVDTVGNITFIAPKTNYGYPFDIAADYAGYVVSLYFLPSSSGYDPKTKTINLFAYIFGLNGEPWNYENAYESFELLGDGIPWVKTEEEEEESGGEE